LFIISQIGTSYLFYITVYKDKREVVIRDKDNKGGILLSFTDKFISDNLFTRNVRNHSYSIENGVILFKIIERKTGFINPISNHNKLTKNFLTFDIETRLIDQRMVPYCISFF
jgi:hypothetical protein